jgi:hypothetical protein
MVNCQPQAAALRDTIEDPPRTARRGPAGPLMILLALGSLAVSAASCAKARAETVPDGPPLATPAPPPRVLAPVEEVLAEAPLPAELPVDLPTAPASDRRPAPRRPAAADTQKPPEPQPQPPVAPPVVAETPVRQPAADPAEEQKIRDILLRASRDLNNVDYRRLQGDGKAQYEQSKRFSELAEAAIKDRNYLLAATHADKAATIAEQLRRQ